MLTIAYWPYYKHLSIISIKGRKEPGSKGKPQMHGRDDWKTGSTIDVHDILCTMEQVMHLNAWDEPRKTKDPQILSKNLNWSQTAMYSLRIWYIASSQSPDRSYIIEPNSGVFELVRVNAYILRMHGSLWSRIYQDLKDATNCQVALAEASLSVASSGTHCSWADS